MGHNMQGLLIKTKNEYDNTQRVIYDVIFDLREFRIGLWIPNEQLFIQKISKLNIN